MVWIELVLWSLDCTAAVVVVLCVGSMMMLADGHSEQSGGQVLC